MQTRNRQLSRELKLIGIGLACTSVFLSPLAAAQSFTSIPRPQVTLPLVQFQLLPRGANLNWGNRASYEIDGPATTELILKGLGINGTVDVLDDDRPFLISEEITNQSRTFIPGDYLYSLRIKQMIFRASGGFLGWVPGNKDTHTVHYQEQRGLDLQPGTYFRTQFGRIDPSTDLINRNKLECGMYEVEMTVDTDDAVYEGQFEFDNVTRHYLYVEGDQIFNISKTQFLNSVVVPPLGLAATRYATFDLSIPFGSSARRLLFTNDAHTRKVKPGARLYAVPSPAQGVPVIFDMGFAPSVRNRAISMMVAAPPPALGTVPAEIFDIAAGTPESNRITVMSEDGCTIRQRVSSIFLL